ncbi:Asp/Glu racemase [Aquabacter sp. L1I39]|uniref:aspartate/glutamate racemase family protein n=1 Tax=Aquabacter sp. L1I39 TaxID=2820278 RepID=UPI001ADAC067|nr:aspartate/glutamate racemase family protein [Aquabacter sp. L1I39]QTL03428.1 Asp/Glu racemase [Aquabacter sp. L1I39]
MKLLILNANTSQDVTARMVRAVEALCPGNVHCVGATAAFGAPYVSTRAAVAVAGHAALEAVRAAVAAEAAAGRPPFDACLYACFGEPGIEALRADNTFPVAGMAEASILTALQLGERFSLITVGAAWPGMLRDLMRRTGLEARFAGFGLIAGDALSLARGEGEGVALVKAAVEEVLATQAPEVVIVGGASLSGYARALAGQFPVPVLDSLAASLEQALALARLQAGRGAGSG